MEAGDLVKVKHDPKHIDSDGIGIVQWVSEKYPPTCAIIVNESVSMYDTRLLEVVNESR